MAQQKGRGLLVQMDISSTFTNIGGLRARSFKMNNNVVDISVPSTSSPTDVVPFTGDYGVQSFEVEGTMLYTDETAMNAVLDAHRAQTQPTCKITVPGYGTFQAATLVESIEFSGDMEGSLESKLKLRMSGTVTFTSA